jgi:hypothetical protein
MDTKYYYIIITLIDYQTLTDLDQVKKLKI